MSLGAMHACMGVRGPVQGAYGTLPKKNLNYLAVLFQIENFRNVQALHTERKSAMVPWILINAQQATILRPQNILEMHVKYVLPKKKISRVPMHNECQV